MGSTDGIGVNGDPSVTSINVISNIQDIFGTTYTFHRTCNLKRQFHEYFTYSGFYWKPTLSTGSLCVGISKYFKCHCIIRYFVNIC